MAATLLQRTLTVSLMLLAAAQVTPGLGELVVLAPEAANPIAGGIAVYSSAEAIDTALDGALITAQTAADLTVALSQNYRASSVYVSTYDDATEDPTDALDAILASGVDVGVVVPVSRTTAHLAALGTWLASGDRRTRYLIVGQSSDASLATATPDAAFAPAQASPFDCHYNDDTASQAAALAGLVAGFDLSAGPIAGRVELKGVPLPSLTEAQQAFLTANNVRVLHALDKGASAKRILHERDNFGGEPFSAVITGLYAARQVRAAMKAMLVQNATLATPTRTDFRGQDAFEVVLRKPLNAMSAANHFTPVEGAPDGFSVDVTASGDALTGAVVLHVPTEAGTFAVPITIIEVS